MEPRVVSFDPKKDDALFYKRTGTVYAIDCPECGKEVRFEFTDTWFYCNPNDGGCDTCTFVGTPPPSNELGTYNLFSPFRSN